MAPRIHSGDVSGCMNGGGAKELHGGALGATRPTGVEAWREACRPLVLARLGAKCFPKFQAIVQLGNISRPDPVQVRRHGRAWCWAAAHLVRVGVGEPPACLDIVGLPGCLAVLQACTDQAQRSPKSLGG